VEAQRKRLQAFEELEAEALVDALEDPEQVVGEGAAERGAVSRPSRNAWTTIRGTRAAAAARIISWRWRS